MSRNLAQVAATEALPPLRPPTLPLEWFDAVRPQLSNLWLVKRLLPAHGIVLIYGHPGSGKTFFALDVSLHVALGRDWSGRKVKPGLVVYVAAEGVGGLRNRVAAFRQHHEISGDLPFAIIPSAIDLQAPDADVRVLAATIRAAAELAGAEPALIILDTLSKTFGSGKENTDDMASYVANCGRIADEFRCCVAPVHHRPKDAESQEPRGHSSLKGGVDTVILVEGGQTKSAQITKQKDGEVGDRFLFNLEIVPLGEDEDGDAVTSCVVKLTDTDLTRAADPFMRAVGKLSPSTRLVFDQLGDLIEAAGIAVPPSIPEREINRNRVGKVGDYAGWFESFLASSGTARGQRGDKDYERARKAFQRAVTSLDNQGVVRVFEGYAWITFTAAGTDRGQVWGQVEAGGQRAGTNVAPPFRGGHPVPASRANPSRTESGAKSEFDSEGLSS